MSGFDLGWLDLREPADHAARDPDLLRQARTMAQASALLVDLGCGSGSTLRAMSLPDASWRLVDNDPLLLRAACDRIDGARRPEPVQADLARIDDLPLEGAGLVTASALLDLVSEAWVAALAPRLAASGAGLYAALTYDGVMRWTVAHPLDAAVTAAFNQHQRIDKGFGLALGPDATEVASRRLEALGFTVVTAPSPWRLDAAQAALERELIVGVAGAAADTGTVDRRDVEAWREARLAGAGQGCWIGHLDLLATLPATQKAQS